MPVRKFRSIEQMKRGTWHEPGSPELFEAMRATWDLAHRTLRPYFPPGVYKHRSLEDAERLRDQWARANFEAYRRRLEAAPSDGDPSA